MGQQGSKSFLQQLREWFRSWFEQPKAEKFFVAPSTKGKIAKMEKETCKLPVVKPGDGYNHKTAVDNYRAPKGTVSNPATPAPVVNNYHHSNDNLLTGVLLGHMMSSPSHSHTHTEHTREVVVERTPEVVTPASPSIEVAPEPTPVVYEAAPEPREVYVAPEPRAIETPSYESSYSAPSYDSTPSSSDYSSSSSSSYDSGSSSYDSGSSGGGGDW